MPIFLCILGLFFTSCAFAYNVNDRLSWQDFFADLAKHQIQVVAFDLDQQLVSESNNLFLWQQFPLDLLDGIKALQDAGVICSLVTYASNFDVLQDSIAAEWGIVIDDVTRFSTHHKAPHMQILQQKVSRRVGVTIPADRLALVSSEVESARRAQKQGNQAYVTLKFLNENVLFTYKSLGIKTETRDL